LACGNGRKQAPTKGRRKSMNDKMLHLIENDMQGIKITEFSFEP